MALDVVRALGKGKEDVFKALEGNLEGVKGKDRNLDKHWETTMDTIEKLGETGDQALMAFYGRKIAADLAVGLQGVEMLRGAEDNIITDDEAGMFIGSRIGEGEEGELNPSRGIYGNAMGVF
jgi:hypothetical protein